jgi:hypothetical protein
MIEHLRKFQMQKDVFTPTQTSNEHVWLFLPTLKGLMNLGVGVCIDLAYFLSGPVPIVRVMNHNKSQSGPIGYKSRQRIALNRIAKASVPLLFVANT